MSYMMMRRRRLGAAGESNAAWLAENADIYINKDTATTGPDSAITGLTTDGKLANVYSIIGTGNEISKGPSGLTFGAGKYLSDNWSGSYAGALTIVDFTRDAAPSGTGEIVRLDTTAGEQHYIRHTSTVNLMLTSEKQHTLFQDKVSIGDRVTLALYTDYANQKSYIIDHNGYNRGELSNTGSTTVTLAQTRIGINCNITLHQAAVFLVPNGESLPETLEQLWSRVSGKSVPSFSDDVYEHIPVIGYSKSIGRTATTDEKFAIAAFNPFESKMINGLELSGGGAVAIHGPQAADLDTNVSATDISHAEVSSSFPTILHRNSVIGQYHSSLGLPKRTLVTQSTVAAGTSILKWDDDTPVTSTDGTTLLDNTEYVVSEIKRLVELKGKTFSSPHIIMLQGVVDPTMLEGEFKAAAQVSFDDLSNRIKTITGQASVGLHAWQDGAGVNTTGQDWYVKTDIIDLVTDNSGVLIGPTHTIPLDTGDAHPTKDGYQYMGELEAIADAETEAGNAWNMIPSAVLNGSVVTFSITLRPGEVLEWAPDRYSGVGIDSFGGFEAVGASITNVSLSGSDAIITCDAPPTGILYALQKQDMSVTDPGWMAHRGLLRGSHNWAAKLSNDTIYRDALSARITFP